MPFLGELAALLTAVLWSATSIAFSEAASKTNSVSVNITRLVIASVFLFLTIILAGIPVNLNSEQIWLLVISGFIGFVFGDVFLFKAFKAIGARISMLIMALAPAIAAILAFVFLKESLSIWAVLGIIVTIGGIAIVVTQRNVGNEEKGIEKIGLLYGFLGALGQAVGMVFAKMAFNIGDVNGFLASFIRVTSAVILLYPLLVIVKKNFNPFKAVLNNKSAFWLTVVGTVTGPFLGVTLSLIAVAMIKVGIASTLTSVVPVIMLPMVKYYYKEELSNASIIGAFITVAGVALLFLV